MNSQVVTSAFPRALLAVAMAVAALLASLTAEALPPPQFGAPTSFPVGNYPESMIVADFNRDDKLDIVVTGGAGVHLLLGLGNGELRGEDQCFLQ